MTFSSVLDRTAGSLAGMITGSGIFRLSGWGYYLACAIFSATAGMLSYVYLDLPQTYPDLVAGAITWEYGNKFHDYITPFNIIVSFLLAFVAMALLAGWMVRSCGRAVASGFHHLIILLSLPAVLGSAGMVISRKSPLPLVAVSAVLIGVAMLLATILSSVKRYREDARKGASFIHALQNLLLMILCAMAAGAALGIALSRVGALVHVALPIGFPLFLKLVVAGGVTGFLLALVLIGRSASLSALTSRCWQAIVGTQLFFPLFFLILVPLAMTDAAGRSRTIAPLSGVGLALILLCMGMSYLAVWRSHRAREASRSEDLFASLPAMSLLGLLLFLKVYPAFFWQSPQDAIKVPMDDYHFGEYLVPWWSWSEKGMLPFWDYAPARGMVNYYMGFFADIFFDGKLASFSSTTAFLYLLLYLPALLLLRRIIGQGPALIALFMSGQFNGLSEIDLCVTLYLAFICHGALQWERRTWVASYISLSAVMLLVAPGQGALAIVSLSPLFLYISYAALRDRDHGYFKVGAAVAGILLALAILTPLGKMLIGAIRYGLEQSGLNSVANGKEWSRYFFIYDQDPWLLQAVRSLWVPVAMMAGLVIIRAIVLRSGAERRRIIVYALPVFILLVLFTIRAVGRIDKGVLSRPGLASVWAVSLLLPLLVFPHGRLRHGAAAICLWVFAGGLLMSNIRPFPGMQSRSMLDPYSPAPKELGTLEAAAFTDPRLGPVTFDPAHLQRLRSMRTLLDLVLDPGETYLDMTGRHGHYYYMDRRPPVESGSVYNLVTEKQQLRGIRSIESLQPPAILMSAWNFHADGGGPALRSYHLYRHVLLRPGFTIVTLKDNIVWLVRDDRVSRIPGQLVAGIAPVDASADNALNAIFTAVNKGKADLSEDEDPRIYSGPGLHLMELPASWGRSAGSLRPKMRDVWRLGAHEWYRTDPAVPDSGNAYLLNGEQAHLVFAIHGKNLGGRDAGLVSFELACMPAGSRPRIMVYWSGQGVPPNDERTKVVLDARNGRMIVPMDAMPSWLLTPRLETLMFVVESRGGAEEIRIGDVRLMERR